MQTVPCTPAQYMPAYDTTLHAAVLLHREGTAGGAGENNAEDASTADGDDEDMDGAGEDSSNVGEDGQAEAIEAVGLEGSQPPHGGASLTGNGGTGMAAVGASANGQHASAKEQPAAGLPHQKPLHQKPPGQKPPHRPHRDQRKAANEKLDTALKCELGVTPVIAIECSFAQDPAVRLKEVRRLLCLLHHNSW